MLSFMREQNLGDSLAQEPPGPAGRLPADSSQDAGDQEYLTVAAHDKNARKTTYVLAIVFGIGLLALWCMIKKSAPSTAAAAPGTAEAQIQMAIAQLTGIKSQVFASMDEIVTKFYEFSNVRQVKVNELAKNPFACDMFLASLKQSPDTKEPDNEPDAEFLRQRQMAQQAKDLKLLSIMQSEQGRCCMIGDSILYEGDSIRGFKVRLIRPGFVKLQWEQDPSQNMEITLKLSQ